MPEEDRGAADVGVVQVLYGSSTGLTATGSRYFTQNSTGISDEEEAGDRFGETLAAAQMGGSTQADLAIGAPSENIGTVVDGAAVHVLLGAASGLTASGSQYWTQNSSGIADAAESGDRFGESLAAANFGGSTQADLAIGVPSENIGTVADAGRPTSCPAPRRG